MTRTSTIVRREPVPVRERNISEGINLKTASTSLAALTEDMNGTLSELIHLNDDLQAITSRILGDQPTCDSGNGAQPKSPYTSIVPELHSIVGSMHIQMSEIRDSINRLHKSAEA